MERWLGPAAEGARLGAGPRPAAPPHPHPLPSPGLCQLCLPLQEWRSTRALPQDPY